MTPLTRASAVIAWALVAGVPGLGQDLRSSGKLRDARAKFSACESARCPAALRRDCAQRVEGGAF